MNLASPLHWTNRRRGRRGRADSRRNTAGTKRRRGRTEEKGRGG